jgi:heme-degrading monooxygenase HmoA
MIVMINPFRVFEGQEQKFLSLWERTNAIFAAKPGYIQTRLMRAIAEQPPGETAPYTHINVALWDSRDAYAEALRDIEIKRFAQRYAEICTYNPALYEIIRETPAK